VNATPQKMFLVPITLTTDMYELVLAHSSKIVIVVTNGTYGPPQLLLCLSYQVVYYLRTLYQIQRITSNCTNGWLQSVNLKDWGGGSHGLL